MLLALEVELVRMVVIVNDGRDSDALPSSVLQVKGLGSSSGMIAGGFVPLSSRGTVSWCRGTAAEKGTEKGSQSGHGCSSDANAGFDSRPDGNVRGRVEEVVDVGQGPEIGKTDNRRARSTLFVVSVLVCRKHG